LTSIEGLGQLLGFAAVDGGTTRTQSQ
jgi:hypothetical protein